MKGEPVNSGGEDSRPQGLSELKKNARKSKLRRSDKAPKAARAKAEIRIPATNPAPYRANDEADQYIPQIGPWPIELICSICKRRFMLRMEHVRHLADPNAHRDTLGKQRKRKKKKKKSAHKLKQSLSHNAPGIVRPMSIFGDTDPQSTSDGRGQQLPQNLDRHIANKDRSPKRSKKRNWEEYAECQIRESIPLSVPSDIGSERKIEELGLISSSNDNSPVKVHYPWASIDPSSGLMPSTPFKSRTYPPCEHPLTPKNLENIPADLTCELSPPKSPGKPLAEPPLCPEQQQLVEVIMSGRNVFYTGSAGCGKSTVLKNFVRRLKSQHVWKPSGLHEPKQVDIIAPTGRAALDINGSTFWTYAGWNPDSMKKPLEKLKHAAEHGIWARRRLRATDVLVIDEISMMENHHLERLNEILQTARGNTRAFGGVQLVVTGDFCQLPPVKPFAFCYRCGKELLKSQEDTVFTCPNGHGEWAESEKWAFCSSAWEAASFVHVNLTTIHRQKDRVFIDILQKCRLGVPFSPEEEKLLLEHECQTGNAVKLFSTRAEVGMVNREAFNRLPTVMRTYNCYDDFRCYNSNLESKGRRSDYDNTLEALREHRFEPRIDLKQGMVVVLLVNLDLPAGLVNGSQGVIMGFEDVDQDKMPEAVQKEDKELSRMGNGPVLLGDYAEERAANIKTFMDNAKTKQWPRVLFQNRVTRTIYADCRITELGDERPYSLISRTQIPLVAGWAMTVHKSQGMTLNRVVVNLTKSFEEGQMYVALSRARTLEGLKVEGLGRQQGCNERVRQFLREKLMLSWCLKFQSDGVLGT